MDAQAPPYPVFSSALNAHERKLAAGVGVPLRLEHRHRWDPEEEYWGEPDEPVAPALRPIIAAGPRDAWELEQAVPGHDWETSEDPILAAVELAARAERAQSRGLLASLLAIDVRCLDAHAHLGLLAFDYSAALALPHFAAGVAIGERSLPAGFAGLLPWGWIDNRPFLRCLHGYGLCLWRLGRSADAAAVFDALLWLNPGDNQGARMLMDTVHSGAGWSSEPDSWRARGAGRRALLDRAAPVLDQPPTVLSPGAFEPLRWLLDTAGDGLPLTQTGALGRQVVRDAAVRFPDWWNSALFGPPNRAAELPLLEELHALSRRTGLLRRRGRRLLLTRRGEAALTDADVLTQAAARGLIAGDQFEREVAELACAALLTEPIRDSNALVDAVHPAVAEDWRTEGGPVTTRAVRWALDPFVHAATGLDALTARGHMLLTADGSELLARALRHSATTGTPPRRPRPR
ncbi:MAG: hypothetical protein WKF94_08605 [Solirubrobacteraceae bacterium]